MGHDVIFDESTSNFDSSPIMIVVDMISFHTLSERLKRVHFGVCQNEKLLNLRSSQLWEMNRIEKKHFNLEMRRQMFRRLKKIDSDDNEKLWSIITKSNWTFSVMHGTFVIDQYTLKLIKLWWIKKIIKSPENIHRFQVLLTLSISARYFTSSNQSSSSFELLI